MSHRSASFLVFSLPILVLAGCGAGGSLNPVASTPIIPAVTGQGRVMGGTQSISGAAVQLYAVSTTADGAASTPLLNSAVTSDTNGYFNLSGLFTCPSASSLVYVTATGGKPGTSSANSAIALMTALGSCGSLSASTKIMVDERTTVAAVAALAPFMRSSSAIGSSSLDSAGLSAAFTLASSFADPATGQVPGPSLAATATAPSAAINTLANILASCVNTGGGIAGDNSACGNFFAATKPAAGSAPASTLSAALNIIRDPQSNTTTLFAMSSASGPFQPQLGAAPSDYTLALSGTGAPAAVPNGCSAAPLTGTNVFTNYTLQQPGVCRHLTAADLPAPYTTQSVTNNSVQVARKSGQMPVVPPGFTVTLYATGFSNARYLLAAANGDLLLSQPGGGSIVVLRGVDANGAAVSKFTYASGLTSPYGMAFYPSAANPQFLYVANTASIVRFPYSLGDTVAGAPPTTLATDIPDSGNHTTRALAFTTEATPRLLVSVGSADNINNTDNNSADYHRADILAYSVAGIFQKIYASGLRNPVGLVIDSSGRPWTSVNERDGLGDNLPAEYVTHVKEDGFYGWPWYYNGPNPDPTLPSLQNHPELQSATILGDALLQPHFAPLQINFYTGTQFPSPYRGDLFVASHGSWNKAVRGGYELVRVRMSGGNATGEYEDFMTGFVNSDGTVWGRPAGVAMGADGALYVADDASNSVWRITYTGN